MYVIFWYGNDSEVYILIFGVGVSLVLIIVGESRFLRLVVMTLIWPGYVVYLLWMRRVLDRLKIIASFKKVLGLILIICVRFIVNGLIYMIVLSGAVGGLIGVVSLSFYVYYLVAYGIWILILRFYVINLTVNVNFKIVVLGVLPLPLFFLKIRRIFCLYGVMVISAMIFLR